MYSNDGNELVLLRLMGHDRGTVEAEGCVWVPRRKDEDEDEDAEVTLGPARVLSQELISDVGESRESDTLEACEERLKGEAMRRNAEQCSAMQCLIGLSG